MSKVNLKKVFIGLFLIVLAVVAALAAFYFLEVKPELAQREQVQHKKLQANVQKLQERAQAIDREIKEEPVVPKDEIPLQSLVEQAKGEYPKEEQQEKEGFLWIDRKTSKMVITLGALNGIRPDNYLTVYDGDQRIGQVAVDTPFDVISYVRPIEKGIDDFPKDYYPVVFEGR